MIFAKDLILKGVAGLAVVGSAGAGVWWYTTQKSENNTPNEPTNELNNLAEKVGLECTGTPNETTGVQCNKKTGSENIKVKQDDTAFDLSTIPNGGGKIKVYKLTASGDGTTNYNKDFKFVIEDNDISSGDNKLEQFETYEIIEESAGNELHLSRKTKSKESIETALGLPSDCKLPENNTSPNNSTSCNDLDEAKIKKINFEGKKAEGATISSGGKVNLTIKKITSSDGHFPFGYIFSFNPTQALSISSSSDNSIEANKAVEFKIKRKDNNSISLEKAWDLNSLAEKAGLKECNGANEKITCNIDDTKLNIKHGDTSKEEGKSKSTTSSQVGKIRVHKGNAGHKEGFKFTIEDGDIALTGSTSTISKLEEFETYEIEEEEGKYYLSRKTKALKEIAKLLGTPDTCNQLGETDQTASCTNLTKDTLKNIKFEGKPDSGDITISDDSTTSNITLKISRASNSTDFPLGYKFTISSDKDISIPQSGTSITIKKKSDADFKIKKGENNALTLERAWDINKLAGKIGLTGCNSSDSGKKCNFGEKINVYLSDSQNATDLKVKNHSGKKITYEVDQEGYNQGFKFKVEEDITLENGTTTVSGTPPNKITKDENNSNTYEIKEMTLGSGTNWYLVKKANSN